MALTTNDANKRISGTLFTNVNTIHSMIPENQKILLFIVLEFIVIHSVIVMLELESFINTHHVFSSHLGCMNVTMLFGLKTE